MKNFLLALMVFSIGLSSCKDETGDTIYLSNGSVTGTIKGNKKDNSSIDEKFSFSNYINILGEQYYQANYTTQMYEFNIEYIEKNGSSIDIEFELSSLTDNTPENVELLITYYKNIDNKVFHFDMNEYHNTISISDFSFDKATGRTKGKIILHGQSNSTEKNATVEATFDVTIKERIE